MLITVIYTGLECYIRRIEYQQYAHNYGLVAVLDLVDIGKLLLREIDTSLGVG
jgi:hypothetical protein